MRLIPQVIPSPTRKLMKIWIMRKAEAKKKVGPDLKLEAIIGRKVKLRHETERGPRIHTRQEIPRHHGPMSEMEKFREIDK